MFSGLLSLILVPLCGGCDKAGDVLCQRCYAQFIYAVPFLIEKYLCIPFFRYTPVARRLLRRYKDEGYTMYLDAFSLLIRTHYYNDPYRVWSKHLARIEGATLLYIATDLYRERYFRSLAYLIAKFFNLTTIGALFGNKPVRFHSGVDDKEKRFRIMINTQWRLKGLNADSLEKVILFDDVITTTATVRSAIDFLRCDCGVSDITVLSLFHTPLYRETSLIR